MKIRRFNENEDPTNKIFDLLDSPDISNRELGFKLISTQEIKSKKLTKLIGKTFNSVYMNTGKDEIYFCSNEKNYIFYHEQDCCESVCVEDIDGDLEDLANTPIINAEEITKIDINNDECGCWTFYKLATSKGYVTIRWYGSSNGYYSVAVSLDEFVYKNNKIEILYNYY